jgi:hypothetical protein
MRTWSEELVNVSWSRILINTLVVRGKGTVVLLTFDPDMPGEPVRKSLYREYYVPQPVLSSFVCKVMVSSFISFFFSLFTHSSYAFSRAI